MEKGVILKDNFLNETIFRIDFKTISELTGENPDNINKFKNKIQNNFPKLEVLQQKSLNVHVEDDIPTSSVDKGNLCWVFHNEEYNKEISLSANNLIITYRRGAYSRFKYFLNDILSFLSALKEYGEIQLEFLGLRYINEINNSEINNNIHKYINQTLFNTKLLEDINDNNGDLIQIFSKLDFQQDDYNLTLQYGFFNPTINPEYEKHFILDYDCINKQITDIDEVLNHLRIMNKIIWKKFDYSITDEFIEKVGETYESTN